MRFKAFSARKNVAAVNRVSTGRCELNGAKSEKQQPLQRDACLPVVL